jgi:hypothetical protein
MTEGLYRIRLADGREFGPGNLNTIVQWAREGRVPNDSLLVDHADPRAVRSVLAEPALRNILQAPPTVFTGLQQPPDTEGTMSGIIPYKNPAALIGYYLSVASLIPLVGVLLGIPAVIMGIIGLRRRTRDPKIKGMAHAWVAIILGGITSLGYGLLSIAIIVDSMN